MQNMRICLVVAARPNFMKAMPVSKALGEVAEVALIHTGQHYDPLMSDTFFEDLDIRRPDFNLGVGSGSHAEQTGRALIALGNQFTASSPEMVVVFGDVNSTLAASLAASELGIPVAHVEAGLRSHDWSMPEELNRVLTDRLSQWLLTPSADADASLLAEGLPSQRIHRVGNVMIDTLVNLLPKARQRATAGRLGLTSPYAVATIHRPSNVDSPEDLARTLEIVGNIGRLLPLVVPTHPRLRDRIMQADAELPSGVRFIDPLGYLDFISLVDTSTIVLTDSGGIQEETSVLGIPCLTMRTTTERPVTIEQGTNRLVGVDPTAIQVAAEESLARSWEPASIPLWDGKAAERIRDVLID